MALDVLFRIGAALLVGAAVGYGVAVIVDALSRAFAELWETFVGAVKQMWGYATEATQHFIALVAQWLEQNWPEIQSYLRQEFGYIRQVLAVLFREGQQAYLGFVDSQGQSIVLDIAPLEGNVQLPEVQNSLVYELHL